MSSARLRSHTQIWCYATRWQFKVWLILVFIAPKPASCFISCCGKGNGRHVGNSWLQVACNALPIHWRAATRGALFDPCADYSFSCVTDGRRASFSPSTSGSKRRRHLLDSAGARHPRGWISGGGEGNRTVNTNEKLTEKVLVTQTHRNLNVWLLYPDVQTRISVSLNKNRQQQLTALISAGHILNPSSTD